jgi:hypothetical protein
MTLKELKEKIAADSYSIKNGVITLRWGFFYRIGQSTETQVQKVLAIFPNAKILDKGEVFKAFSGDSSVANSSHWFVKFKA